MSFLRDYPDDVDANYLLVQVGIKAGAYQQILPLLTKCIALTPDKKELILQLAQVQNELGMLLESKKTYQQLTTRFASWATGWFYFSEVLLNLGDTAEAKACLLKAIEISPEDSKLYLALCQLKTFSSNDPLIEKMVLLLEELKATDKPDYDQMQLHYALGKIYSDLTEYQKAFSHWQKANSIQLSQCTFRVAEMKPFFQQVKNTFNNWPAKNWRKLKNEDSVEAPITPIFILGLPRTGSTLLEQMLVRHTEIESAGEVNYVSQMIAGGAQRFTAAQYPTNIEQLSDQQWQHLGRNYLAKLATHQTKSRFVIDKLPANFQSIGLIQRALPNAIIIHLTRRIEAVALSIFRNYFAANEPYFCDLQELANYHAEYQSLMAIWQSQFGNQILELSYEQLIRSPQESLQSLVSSCGLQWQPECLNFHLNEDKVNTLSEQQVKRPLYTTSVEEWRHYQTWLTPYFC